MQIILTYIISFSFRFTGNILLFSFVTLAIIRGMFVCGIRRIRETLDLRLKSYVSAADDGAVSVKNVSFEAVDSGDGRVDCA